MNDTSLPRKIQGVLIYRWQVAVPPQIKACKKYLLQSMNQPPLYSQFHYFFTLQSMMKRHLMSHCTTYFLSFSPFSGYLWKQKFWSFCSSDSASALTVLLCSVVHQCSYLLWNSGLMCSAVQFNQKHTVLWNSAKLGAQVECIAMQCTALLQRHAV